MPSDSTLALWKAEDAVSAASGDHGIDARNQGELVLLKAIEALLAVVAEQQREIDSLRAVLESALEDALQEAIDG